MTQPRVKVKIPLFVVIPVYEFHRPRIAIPSFTFVLTVIFSDKVNMVRGQQFGHHFLVLVGALAQIDRGQMKAKHLYRAYQWVQALGGECRAMVGTYSWTWMSPIPLAASSP